MFRKWFIRCVAVLVLVIGALSVTLAYQFTQNKPGANAAEPKENGSLPLSAAEYPRSVSFATVKPVVVVKNQRVDPFSFLSDATPSEVVAFFREEIKTDKPGKNEIILTLNDGTQRADIIVDLYVLDAIDIVTREAGTQASPLTVRDFIAFADEVPLGLEIDAELLTDLSSLDFYDVGNYDVELKINGVRMNSTLRLMDVTPPSAVASDLSVNLGQAVEPKEFVREINDASSVTAYYKEGIAPDVFLPGEHAVTVILEDDFGNKAEYTSVLRVLSNTEPPRFVGLKNLEALLGNPVMYRKGVTAVDSFGNELEFEVLSGGVNINMPGEYPVIYSTMDADGNRAEESVTLRVVDITEDAITDMLNTVMDRIIKEDMTTQREKAEAIFNWIRNTVSYVSDAPKDSVYEGAYRALQYRQGDCFTFYSIAEIMLTREGIPNERVTRIEGATNHYWNLVNCDGEGWYHFDSTPVAVSNINRFMFTDSEAEAYTERIQAETRARNYYTYDKTLHPEVVQ